MIENHYMELALEYARKALLVNEVPVGAVLINANNKELVAARHNESISKKNPLNHAELLVIKDACKIKNSRYLNDMIIFITLEPCAMCAAAISEARIKKLYFGAYDEKKGSIENNIRIFSNKNYFKPEIYGGIKEKECSLLLKNFFEQKRN